jgi:hypothetical protein
MQLIDRITPVENNSQVQEVYTMKKTMSESHPSPLLKEENHLHPEQSIICVAVKLQSASSKIHFFEDKRLDTF